MVFGPKIVRYLPIILATREINSHLYLETMNPLFKMEQHNRSRSTSSSIHYASNSSSASISSSATNHSSSSSSSPPPPQLPIHSNNSVSSNHLASGATTAPQHQQQQNYHRSSHLHRHYSHYQQPTTLSIAPEHPSYQNDSQSPSPDQLSPSIAKSHLMSKSTGNLMNAINGAFPPPQQNKQIEEYELGKIEMFYRSHRTYIFVGRCLANLYFTETDLVDGGRSSKPRAQDWKLTMTGVPVLLFNKGDTKSRDKRQIQISLAERGTGFPLWSDIIDNLSNYSVQHPTFHTMYLSVDHRKMAGLSFDCQNASSEFHRQIEMIVSNPLNISLTGPKKKTTDKLKLFRRNRSKSVGRNGPTNGDQRYIDPFGFDDDVTDRNLSKRSAKNKLPKKCDISSPCLFQHITTVNLYNCDEFQSMSNSSPVVVATPTGAVINHLVHRQHHSSHNNNNSNDSDIYHQQSPQSQSPISAFKPTPSPVYSTPEPMSGTTSDVGSSIGSTRSSSIGGHLSVARTSSFNELNHSALSSSSAASNFSY